MFLWYFEFLFASFLLLICLKKVHFNHDHDSHDDEKMKN